MLKNKVAEIVETIIFDYPMTAKEIAEGLGVFSRHDTIPEVRKAIRQLIKDGCPIGSNGLGYYWIHSRPELEDALEGLQARCDAIQERITDITKSYNKEMNSRHLDTSLLVKDRCRFFVIYIAETARLPYQAVWSMAYRKLQKLTGVDLVNLPSWYQGSVLNYCVNRNITQSLYHSLERIERSLI